MVLSNFLKGVKVKSFQYKMFVLSSIFAFVLLLFLTETMINTYYLSEDLYKDEPRTKGYQIMINYYKVRYSNDVLQVIPGLRVVFFIRMAYMFSFTPIFGKLVIITFQMIYESALFLCFYFLLLLFFTAHCNLLFWELDAYNTSTAAFFSLFSEALGGFDLGNFTGGGELFSENGGKFFLVVFLTLTTIILLNFFIAILADVYGKLNQYNDGARMQKILEFRQTYEYHPHYACLTKMPIFFSYLLIPLAPIVIIAKSERLNKRLLKIEGFLAVMIFFCFNMIICTVLIIGLIIFMIFKKFKNLGKNDDRSKLAKLIDIPFTIMISPLICITMVCAHFYMDLLYSINTYGLAKNTEVNKEEYNYINNKMGGTNKDKETASQGIKFDQEYYLFKKCVFGNKNINNNFNPGNKMLSEMTILILVTTIKIVETRVRKEYNKEYPNASKPVYLPLSYLMDQFSKHLFINQSLKAFIFGEQIVHFDYESQPAFIELVETLADRSLNNYDFNQEIHLEAVGELEDSNYVLQALKIKGYNQRIAYWQQKLLNYFKLSNRQWLLDQYKYCKWFMLNNSRYFKLEEVSDTIKQIVKKKLRATDSRTKERPLSKAAAGRSNPSRPKSSMAIVNESWENKGEQKVPSGEEKRIKMVNLTTMSAYFAGYLTKTRALVSEKTNKFTHELSSEDALYLRMRNQLSLKRFTSMNLGDCYAATRKE